MQKFEESDEFISERRDIVVIADENYRSQYDAAEQVRRDSTIVKALPGLSRTAYTG